MPLLLNQSSSKNTSLTKHGAHKVAMLLRKVPYQDVLHNVFYHDEDVRIDISASQAKKNLSAYTGVVPDFWGDAVALNSKKAIDALVLFAIVCSHSELLKALIRGASALPFKGVVRRSVILDEKSFTNFKNNVDELGFATEATTTAVSYDFTPLFNITGVSTIARQILESKLVHNGWNGATSLVAEAIDNQLHRAFAVPENLFIDWLINDTLIAPSLFSNTTTGEDKKFFADEIELTGAWANEAFAFVPGHTKRKVGTVSSTRTAAEIDMELLHNEMQDKLYNQLVAAHGAANVATELATGVGTSIDVATQSGDGGLVLYEIKTATSVKACIRQALPQLLEYAYWPSASKKIDKLIIVGPPCATAESERYLETLRSHHNLPIYYEQYQG